MGKLENPWVKRRVFFWVFIPEIPKQVTHKPSTSITFIDSTDSRCASGCWRCWPRSNNPQESEMIVNIQRFPKMGVPLHHLFHSGFSSILENLLFLATPIYNHYCRNPHIYIYTHRRTFAVQTKQLVFWICHYLILLITINHYWSLFNHYLILFIHYLMDQPLPCHLPCPLRCFFRISLDHELFLCGNIAIRMTLLYACLI